MMKIKKQCPKYIDIFHSMQLKTDVQTQNFQPNLIIDAEAIKII